MPSRNAIASILNRVGKAFDKKATVGPPPSARYQAVRPDPTPGDDDDDYEPVGLNGVLASTEKLLAVNRGLIPPDERDSAQFKKTFRTHQMLGERIRMDADHLRRTLMFRAAKTRNLSGLHSFYFDPYAEKQLISNSLSTPLEEINPMQLVEQSRRMTLMGPGGLGSANAITEESQALHPSTFGFLSALEGPESERIGIDTRLAFGTKIGSNGQIYQRFYDRRSGKIHWMSPMDLDGLTIKLPD